MFNLSFANLPKINDYLPGKQTKENSYRSSICPTYKMIDLSVVSKMPKELLFFMFYMHKGEAEQYLAAGCSWGEGGPKTVIRNILESIDRDSMLAQARQDILARIGASRG